MTAMLTAPPPLKSPRLATPPQPYRFTVKQFHQLWELGYFTNRLVWLYRGTLIDNGPMNPPHAVAGVKTEETMRDAFGKGWHLRSQKPLVLGLDTDPEPDVAMIAGRPTVVGGHPTTAALVIEISDTTFDEDVTTKAELYATAGIADYWVLDVDARTLHVFRDPAPLTAQLQAVAYQTHLTFNDTQTVSPLALPTATINVADLLP